MTSIPQVESPTSTMKKSTSGSNSHTDSSFISRLPLELLVRSLAEATSHHLTFPASFGQHPAARDNVQLQLVCRLWREAVASSPVLWSKVETSMKIMPERFEALLKRSSPVPLDVVLTSGTAPGRPIRFKRIEALLEVLEEEGYRLRSLELVDSFGAMVFMAKNALFAKPLSHLEALTLDVGGADNFSQAHYYGVLHLPELFQDNPEATPLKRLTLFAAVPWPNNRFPHLTHLTISHAVPGDGLALDPTEFLAFMRHSPNLAHLTLDTIGKVNAPPADAAAVSMPNLRQVHIRNCIWFTAVIMLGHLVLPATTSVEVLAIRYGMGHNVIKWLLGPDAAYMRNAGAPTTLALALRGHTICVWLSGPTGSMEVKLNAEQRRSLQEEYRHRWLTTAFCMLPLSLDLSNVEDFSLAMTRHAFVPSRVMRRFLLKMPKVRDCTLFLAPGLGKRYWTRCMSPRGREPAPFPRLQQLELVGKLVETWIPTAAQIASLVLRRSRGGCDTLAELVCSTLLGSATVVEDANPSELKIGRCHVEDVVGSLILQWLYEFPLLHAVDLKTWNSSEID